MATTSGDTDLAARLRLAITRTARRLRQEAGEGVSPSAAAALATIERHGPLSPSELAEREGVARPTATRVLTRLEEAGLVARQDDPEDGRSALVSATPDGRQLLKRIRSRKTAYLAKRLERLDREEREAVERATAVLERLLEEDRR